MARQNIGGTMDDGNLNKVNYNFIELYQMHQRMTATLNDLVLESGGDSNLEVVQARGGKTVLNDRLNEHESLLSRKVNRDEYNEFKGVTEVTFMAIDAKLEGKEPPTPQEIVNLWDLDNTVLGTLNEGNGNLNPHEQNRTTDFIPVESNVDYSFYFGNSIKIVWYGGSENYISGEQGWLPLNTHYVIRSPEEAKYLRVTLSVPSSSKPEDIVSIINIGPVLVTDLDDGTMWDGGFWDFIPQPPLKEGNVKTRHIADGAVTEDKLSPEVRLKLNEAKSNVDQKEPYPKKLSFVELSNGWNEVSHLSSDGRVVYFKYGSKVCQSLDDGNTIIDIFNFKDINEDIPSIQAVRDTGDGELLVSTTRDESKGLMSKLFKSVGYDRNNPGNTQFVEVLEALSSQANIYESWGLDVHDNVVIAGEYGLRGENGARHVWLSTDYGNTFDLIFDQKTTTQNITGAPTWTTSAHVHTAAYDRFWERIWIVVGDRPNSATYYSDDWGQTWTHVNNDIDMQYTGIVAFKEGVIFGSDRGPNGLYVWYRTENKTDDVVIEPLKIINDDPTITHIFQRPFRRWSEKGELVLFPATRASSSTIEQGSVILGFTGVSNPHILYELDGENVNRSGFINCVGVTARGNILTSYHNGTNHSILRARAPIWE